jgi:hypothetical protein
MHRTPGQRKSYAGMSVRYHLFEQIRPIYIDPVFWKNHKISRDVSQITVRNGQCFYVGFIRRTDHKNQQAHLTDWRPTMNRTFALFAAAAAVAITGLSLTTTDAEAKRGSSSQYRQWEFDSNRPIRGYEGFGSMPGEYCSYRREPERRCFYTANDREKCKIVSWRLIQTCK